MTTCLMQREIRKHDNGTWGLYRYGRLQMTYPNEMEAVADILVAFEQEARENMQWIDDLARQLEDLRLRTVQCEESLIWSREARDSAIQSGCRYRARLKHLTEAKPCA